MNAYQKLNALRACWGFASKALMPPLGLDGKQGNALSRLLERPVTPDIAQTLAAALADLQEKGRAESKPVGQPVDVARLADVLRDEQGGAFFAYLSELYGGDSFSDAADSNQAKGTAVGEDDDIRVMRDLIGNTPELLRLQGSRAFPPILTGALDPVTGPTERCTFLYRLGTIETPESRRALVSRDYEHKADGAEPIYVIRRMPGRVMFDPRDGSVRLRYEERYVEQCDGGPARTFLSDGYVFAQEDALTFFLRDRDPSYASRPSLMQLNWQEYSRKLARPESYDDSDLMPGVITCESDLEVRPKPPTSYRALLRLLPLDMSWEEVKDLSFTKRLGQYERAEDGRLIINHPEGWGDEENIREDLVRPWSFYFERLNIIRNPVDMYLRQRAEYIPNGEANGQTAGAHASA